MENLTQNKIEVLVEKWEKKGFKLAEIADQKARGNMAILLENEHQYISEAGSTITTDIADFRKILMPLTRRVFPNLLANEIVGVQPMAGPVSLAYALRHRTGTGTYNSSGAPVELGYNNIDKAWTGGAAASAVYPHGTNALPTSAGERLSSVDPSSAGQIQEANLEIFQATVTAGTRKLKSRYSLEAAQDLKNVHGLDIEAELTNMLQYEIAAEIDRELVDLINAKGGTAYSDGTAKPGSYIVTSGDGQWEAEKFRNLYTRFVREAGNIAIKTRRGAGNFIIASSNVITALDSLGTFLMQPLAGANPMEINPGVAKVGSIENRFQVYRDTFATSDYATIGYKGPGAHNSGVIYCPYIPLMISRAVEPGAFYPVIGVMTRYGLLDHLFGASDFYSKLSVDFTGLKQW